jgi:HAD superfamily hydrolase (TIGR01484 family)
MTHPDSPPPFSACPPAARRKCTRLFFDVDDTVTWRGRLPEESVRALYRAHEAGLSLVAVTGRSFAWGELLVRLLPLDAVVVETGAAALFHDKNEQGHPRLVVMHHEEDGEVRAALRHRRRVAAGAVLAQVPTARLATDNVGRLADTAFDLVEEGPPVPADDATAIRRILDEAGLVSAQSSVHINAFALGPSGPFDKATMVDRLLRRMGDTTLADVASTLCYVGDSTNDGPLFSAAGMSVGVGNVKKHLPALHERGQAPRYVVDGDGGFGFAQVVATLLEARHIDAAGAGDG